jgi:hypothetical protein
VRLRSASQAQRISGWPLSSRNEAATDKSRAEDEKPLGQSEIDCFVDGMRGPLKDDKPARPQDLMHLLRVNSLEGSVPDLAEEILGFGLEGQEGLSVSLVTIEVEESLHELPGQLGSSGALALQYT